MPYSVWKNGQKIGETRFELCPGPRKRAGVFHPTAFGLSVLPGITAMGPALLDFGAMCRERGVDVDDNRPETAERAFDDFADTPQAARIRAAASCIADLEVRDGNGRTLGWDSIMISDMNEIAKLAERRRRGTPDQLSMLPGDPIRFMISTTLADVPDPRRRVVAVAGESLGIC